LAHLDEGLEATEYADDAEDAEQADRRDGNAVDGEGEDGK
jgi:hypothetical protein